MKTVLVVECQPSLDWTAVFAGAKVPSTGEDVGVVQGTWNEISLVSYDDQPRPIVTVRRNGGQQQETVSPDIVLLRSVSHGIAGQDSRALLYGLAHSGVPCVNSAMSAIACLERPVVFGALKGIRAKLGRDAFPLIEQNYYPSHRDLVIVPPFPAVVKVGHAHAGFGKIKVTTNEVMQDVKALCALHADYVTAEPFVNWDWDCRVQRIGSNVRVFRRVSQNWKGNVGMSSIVSDAPVEPHHRVWAEECSKLFGGLDILGLDLLHPEGAPDDKAVILELNDTAIGLVHEHEKEDMGHMRDLVLAKLDKSLHSKAADEAPRAEATHGGTVPEADVLRAELAQVKRESEARIRALEEQLAAERAKKKTIFGF